MQVPIWVRVPKIASKAWETNVGTWSIVIFEIIFENDNTWLPPLKTLSSVDDHGEFINENNRDENYVHNEIADQILNQEITVEEIYLRVRDLKNGKACSTDNILNEFIKSTFEEMKYVYVDLFN